MRGKRRSAGEGDKSQAKRAKLSELATDKDRSRARQQQVSSIVVDEEEGEFPRGGKETLTPLEKRLIKEQAQKDVLFGEGAVDEDVSKVEKSRTKRPAVSSTGSKATQQQKRLDIPNAKKLVPGVLLLGAVLEIHEYEVLVSLPFNMRGSVAITDISDHMTKLLQSEAEQLDTGDNEVEDSTPNLSRLFGVGQLLPCYVLGVEGGTRVSLSVNPRLVNAHLTHRDIRPGMLLSASIRSIEDHGYIVDFCVENKTGFLLRKNAAEFIKSSNRGKPLSLGQVIHCLVLPGADARSVPVSINPSQVGGALLPSDSLLGINTVVPGLLVSAAIKEIATNGLVMSFLGGFEGVVSLSHLQTPSQHSTDGFKVKKKFKARVLWVDMAVKNICLTVQKQIVSGRSYRFDGIDIGDKFDAAKVIHVDHASCLYLELANDVVGYAPSRLISDEKTSSSRYRPGSLHPCRVVQFNLMDRIPIVSLQASVLEKPYMKFADVSIGEVVEGTVEKFGNFGMIVSLSDSIRGLCPKLHLSDVRSIIKQPKKKYKEGSKVKCRVLSVEPSERRLLLSCKKTLLRSAHDPLTDYTQASVGGVYHGVISSVHRYGCIVHFYNQVRGLVLKSELSSTHAVQDPASEFWVGQPVECKVLESEPSAQKLLLSLKLNDFLPVSMDQDESLASGDIINVEVTGIASNGVNLRHQQTGEVAFLPSLHLSDYSDLCTHLLNFHQTQLERTTKEGQVYSLEGVLVLSGRQGFKPAQVTMKQTLLDFTKKKGFAETFTDFKVGMVQPGVVKKVMPYGCFVEFPHGISGLAPLKFLTDEFISSPTGVYGEMQTVWTKVHDISDEQGRLVLSLRPSDLKLSHQMDSHDMTPLIVRGCLSYLRERDTVLAGASGRSTVKGEIPGGRTIADLARLFQPGGCVSGHVISMTGDTSVIELESGAIGKARTDSPLEEGSQVTGCVLDVDLLECCLVLSLNPQLVATPTPKKKSRKSAGAKVKFADLHPGSTLLARVEHKTQYYFVVSCTTISGSCLAYGVMDTGQIGVLPSHFKNIKVGQQVSTTVTSDNYRDIPIVVVTDTVTSSSQSSRVRSSSSFSSSSPLEQVKEGDILSVVVQGVRPTQLNVKYSLWRGRVHCTLTKDDDVTVNDVTMTSSGKPSKRTLAFAGVTTDSVLKARVVKIKEQQVARQSSKKGATIKVLELTTRPSLLDTDVEVNCEQLMKRKFSSGDIVNGVVEQVQNNGLHVLLSPKSEGFVPLLRLSKSPEVLQNFKKCFCEGQLVRCTVLGPKKDTKKKGLYDLSMIGEIGEPSVGDIVLGVYKDTVADHALLLATPHGVGRVDVTDISDHYVDSPLDNLKKKKFVRCCVVGVSGTKLDFSLRSSRTGVSLNDLEQTDGSEDEDEGERGVSQASCDPEITSLQDLAVGKIVRGYVKAVTDVGAFVRLGRGIDGRVQITHLIDGFVKNFKKLYSPGKLVTAKVLSIDPVKGRVELSLRLSQVDPEAAKKLRMKKERKKKKQTAHTSDGENVEGNESSEEENSCSESSGSSSSEESDVQELSSDEEMETVSMKTPSSKSLARPTLQLSSSGFHWDVGVAKGGKAAGEETSSESEEEDEEEKEPVTKKTRRQKKAAQKAEEAGLYQTERTLLDTDRAPENADDFDRLLISSPNHSALWTQYMAFYLHTAEVDKARSIAQRALKTIAYREEGEKLNVWVAWMNLENLYGSHEQLVKVFESALQQNEPIEVFTRLVAIYEQSNKMDLADQLYQTMTKKFGNVLRVWSDYGSFLMRRRKMDAARNLLQRSFKSLPSKQDHVDTISKFAQLEFKHGEPERGRTMFESLLSTYPKRVDLWAVYTDMAIKLGDPQRVRDIYERAIHLKLSTKKMKFMFKRYLEFEQKHGSRADMEAVKEKARAYVEARTSET